MDSIKNINFIPLFIHQEEEPDLEELNSGVTQIQSDLKYIDDTLTSLAFNYNSLIENAKTKINNIKTLINTEKERQEDVNILCNKYSAFSSVVNINEANLNGNLIFDNGVLTAPVTNIKVVSYTVSSIDGNGQAGNSYVYANNAFTMDTLDTSNTSSINDSSLSTYYEYQRITMNNSEEGPAFFNKDSKEAECSIILTADDYINKITVNSDRDDLILTKVYISNDGVIYNLDKEYDIQINKNQEKYNNQTYIYGSGIIAVPITKYVKLCFKSNGYTDDELAYKKAFTNNSSTTTKIVTVNSAKRHLIKLNNITLNQNVYTKGSSITNELITDPIKYISLYCNEYASSKSNIEGLATYSLIINGTEYPVVPINSQRNGTKIIRVSAQTFQVDNTVYVKESIKSAKLKIIANGTANVTPYISNIKVLIGGYSE
jgi:hypothetical protein